MRAAELFLPNINSYKYECINLSLYIHISCIVHNMLKKIYPS